MLLEISYCFLTYPLSQLWTYSVTDLLVLLSLTTMKYIAIRESHYSGILSDSEGAIANRYGIVKDDLMAFILAILGQ